ncbi:hypothetical protein J0B03_08185 [Alkalibacter rhizosphaerae]|uniref:Uncharacterized protein n=1 Tax=Alkalibacter rhizosphaerae TaxID=2815577 RepID=A0A975AHS5_9FIRM|nr:hypothetical protein [Alkalibacter rhizosphaerae]QSX07795.1 hypothetical protein J0B03_08185 [Alkalibacter rhizosphaerae]
MRIKYFILIFLGLMLVGCQQTTPAEEDLAKKDAAIDQLEERVEQLEEQILQLEGELQQLEDFRTGTGEFVNKAITVLPPDSLRIMAQLDWTYELLLNDAPLPENGQIRLTENEFTFTISEIKNSNTILPADISEMGKVSGSIFSNHIQFPETKPSDILGNDTHLVSSATYVFSQLEWGTTLEFVLSEELQERLGSATNTLTVRIPERYPDGTEPVGGVEPE